MGTPSLRDGSWCGFRFAPVSERRGTQSQVVHERNRCAEALDIAGLADVAGGDEGEPEVVVAARGAVAEVGGGVPPVVDAAVLELTGGVELDLVERFAWVQREPDL